MTKFFKGVVIFYVALFAVYFFLADAFIKWQLEREGSRALQAPVHIGKVTFHLLPTSLTLFDVHIGNARVPNYDLVQFEELSLPLSLRDLLAHKLIVDAAELRGLRFDRPRDGHLDTNLAASATASPQLRAALEQAQQMLNHPLSSNTIDPNASITGTILADEFKPLLARITMALNALATASPDVGGWQILVRRANVDGVFEIGDSGVRFIGTLENLTPQPALFNAVTHIDLRSAEAEKAALLVSGSLDNRKLMQTAVRFDLKHFPIARWPLSDDPELKILLIAADMNIQAMLSMTGNQLDLNALLQLQHTRFDIALGNNEIARTVADVWRRAEVFDIHLQASGNAANPVLKMNSSLDVPLAAALQQLQSASPAPSAAFPTTP